MEGNLNNLKQSTIQLAIIKNVYYNHGTNNFIFNQPVMPRTFGIKNHNEKFIPLMLKIIIDLNLHNIKPWMLTQGPTTTQQQQH